MYVSAQTLLVHHPIINPLLKTLHGSVRAKLQLGHERQAIVYASDQKQQHLHRRQAINRCSLKAIFCMQSKLEPAPMSDKLYLADVQMLRARVQRHIADGATVAGEGADDKTLFSVLNDLLANEMVCVQRYERYRSVAADDLNKTVADGIADHSAVEQIHVDQIAERITALGGEPELSPLGLRSRNAVLGGQGKVFVDLVKEDMLTECISMDTYREVIAYLGDRDPKTCQMLQEILAGEELHARKMSDLLEGLSA